jgi:hypothetical protein
LRSGKSQRPASSTNSVPAADSANPIGAIEKMPRPGRPASRSACEAMRNAGAPMIVIVVPSEAANDIGISRREAGIFRERARSSVTGSMSAVVVRWCVNADNSATAGMITAMARAKPAPARRATQRPSVSETPVWCSAALSTKTAATTMAGSLPKPASALSGSSRPEIASASTISTATTSLRSRSVIKSTNATARMTKKTSWGVSRPVTFHHPARGVPAGCF